MNSANVFVKIWFIYTKFLLSESSKDATIFLLHSPNIEYNTLKFLVPFRSTQEETVVHPSIATIRWSFKLRGGLEIERRIAVLVLSTIYNTSVANMDIDTIVCLNAIDSL